MRTYFSRPAFFEGARDVAPMLIGIVPFGIVCGIGAITAGASPIAALAMSMIMFSGAAQIIAILRECDAKLLVCEATSDCLQLSKALEDHPLQNGSITDDRINALVLQIL